MSEIKYSRNTTVRCTQCHGLRYFGYAYKEDYPMCECPAQTDIATYDTETKAGKIIYAVHRAKKRQSKLDGDALMVPALSSLNIRHLMNNLGSISTRYLECGTHKGGLFCSTIHGNDNLLSATANDNFASDEESEDKAFPQFIDNVAKHKHVATEFHLLVGDTFEVDPNNVVGPVDLYLFDADHKYESQRDAVTYFLDKMADEFILCVDDFDWPEVFTGTEEGIVQAGVEVLHHEIFEGNNHDNEGWWNGFAVFLLKKK